MASGNGKDTKNANVQNFPPMTALAAFHDVVGHISDCVGDDNDNPPMALCCIVLRKDEYEQFTLGTPESMMGVLGALEMAKVRIMDDMLCEEE